MFELKTQQGAFRICPSKLYRKRSIAFRFEGLDISFRDMNLLVSSSGRFVVKLVKKSYSSEK